jgi:hypothetical protein
MPTGYLYLLPKTNDLKKFKGAGVAWRHLEEIAWLYLSLSRNNEQSKKGLGVAW